MIILHDKFDQSAIYVAAGDVRRVQKHGPRHSLVTFADGRQAEVCEMAQLIYERRAQALGHEYAPPGNRRGEEAMP